MMTTCIHLYNFVTVYFPSDFFSFLFSVTISRYNSSIIKKKYVPFLSGCITHGETSMHDCPVGWGCRIHRLLLCRGIRPHPTSVLDMTLHNLMGRFQQCWNFGECGVPIHCHRSQVHSGPEW